MPFNPYLSLVPFAMKIEAVCVCKRDSERERVEISVNVFMWSVFERICREDLGLQTDLV